MRIERIYRTEGIVLRRQDFGEADRIVSLYSPTHGKLQTVAKGARRPKSRIGGHVELFTHVNVLVAQGRTLDIITQAETLRPFGHIRDDLWGAAYACYCAELVDRLTEERLENRAIFDLLLQELSYLDEVSLRSQVSHPTTVATAGMIREQSLSPVAAGPASEKRSSFAEPGALGGGTGPATIELSLRAFELRLLAVLGYAPELFRCVQCGQALRPAENRFSPSSGGTVCDGCSVTHPGALPLSVNAIKAMRLMSQEPFGVFQRLRLGGQTAREIDVALRAHVNYILERQLRTAEFLDRLRADGRRDRPSGGAPAPLTRLPA